MNDSSQTAQVTTDSSNVQQGFAAKPRITLIDSEYHVVIKVETYATGNSQISFFQIGRLGVTSSLSKDTVRQLIEALS